MKKVRTFARIESGAIAEIVPPIPLDAGWIEIMPSDGDIRPLYCYPADSWVEITGVEPAPLPNWDYADGVFSEPPAPEAVS